MGILNPPNNIFMLQTLVNQLNKIGVQNQLCDGALPSCTVMHNLDHEIPQLIIWPKSTEEVQQALSLIAPLKKLQKIPISIISGGHGYNGEAMCTGITFDMQFMKSCVIKDNKLIVEPGCGLRKVIDVLQEHSRIIPHGDSLTVGAGGHFISAGWDLLLTRKYGLGCQHVTSATIVYWDGTAEVVTQETNPKVLHSIKGSFGNFQGIITELTLDTFDTPSEVHLARVVLDLATLPKNIIQRSYNLPPEISTTLRFFFIEGTPKLVLILGTLMSKEKTIDVIAHEICKNLAEQVKNSWVCESLSDVRFLPLERTAQEDWKSIVDMTTEEFEEISEKYWKRDVFLREMKVSYCQQRSYWINITAPNTIFKDLIYFLKTISPEFQEKVYGNVTIGGGEMWKNKKNVSMPIGQAIIRFESHCEDLKTHQTQSKHLSYLFTKVSEKYREKELIGKVYSGDKFNREK